MHILSEESKELVRVINEQRTNIIINPYRVWTNEKTPWVHFSPTTVNTHDMCVSLGIAIATDLPFLDVCQSLGRHMALTGYKPDRTPCYSSYLEELGYQNIVEPIPTLKGKTSIGLVSLGFTNCIVITNSHLYPIVHGCVVDNWDSRKTRAIAVWVHHTELARMFA